MKRREFLAGVGVVSLGGSLSAPPTTPTEHPSKDHRLIYTDTGEAYWHLEDGTVKGPLTPNL